METLSYIVLILLSLQGYSGGAVGKGGKLTDIKPQILDLVIILSIWAAALYSRITLDFNRWVMILIWVVLSAIIGGVAVALRKFPETKKSEEKEFEEFPSGLFKPLWERWKKFSKRMESFQSQMIPMIVVLILFGHLLIFTQSSAVAPFIYTLF